MTCVCADCPFKGMAPCEHRQLMDENNALRNTIQEAKDRITYYFGDMAGEPQLQNVYDVLCRNDNGAFGLPSDDEEGGQTT